MLQKLPGQKKREFTSTFTITIYMLAGYSPSVLLPRITIHNQEKRLWELTKWSLKGKFFDLYKFSWRILWRMYQRSVWRICMLDTRAYKWPQYSVAMVTIAERFQCSFLKERFSIHDCSAIALVFLKSILFINNLTEQAISTKFKKCTLFECQCI